MSEPSPNVADADQPRALWSLVESHLERLSITERSFARTAGFKHQTLNAWKHRDLRRLPHRESLDQLATALGLPYVEVLSAALGDAGYLDDVADLGGADPTTGLSDGSRRVVLELIRLLHVQDDLAP
ncbi:MAG TPA: hypothetical protein VGC67_08725 [Cellulomonas sp.]